MDVVTSNSLYAPAATDPAVASGVPLMSGPLFQLMPVSVHGVVVPR